MHGDEAWLIKAFISFVEQFKFVCCVGDPTKVCFNSKLRRCCPNEGVTCISRTTLTVANQVVEVKIYYNVTGMYNINFILIFLSEA